MPSFAEELWSGVGMSMLFSRRAVLIGGAAAGLASCDIFEKDDAGRTGATLGVLTPLTGDGAVYGVATKKGVDLAADEINAAGGVRGKPLKIVYEDDRMSPTDGVSAFQRLIATQKPSAVIGPFGSSVVLAVAPIANSARVPILSASATADSIADAGDFVFRITPPNSRQGADDAAYSWTKLGARRAMVIFQNNEYGLTLRDAFVRKFRELGGEVVAQEGFDLGATDYRAALGKARSLKPDVIFFPLHSQESTLLLRQAREQGVPAKFISADGAMTSELIEGAGPAAEGAYFSTLALGFGVADQQIEAFKAAHARKYGAGEPDVYSAYYYEATKLLAKAIETGGTKPEQVKTALYAMTGDKAFTGITGSTSFNAKGEVDKPFYIYQVQHGAFALAPL